MPRFRITVTPPDSSDQLPRTYVTLPLEPIELRSLIYAATRMLEREAGWTLEIHRLPDDEPS